MLSVLLPTRREIPQRVEPIRGILVGYGAPGSVTTRRHAAIEECVPTAENHFTSYIATLPDDWLSLDDLQMLIDAVDIHRGRRVVAIETSHALRRAILVLIQEDGGSGDGLPVRADKDCLPRVIRIQVST